MNRATKKLLIAYTIIAAVFSSYQMLAMKKKKKSFIPVLFAKKQDIQNMYYRIYDFNQVLQQKERNLAPLNTTCNVALPALSAGFLIKGLRQKKRILNPFTILGSTFALGSIIYHTFGRPALNEKIETSKKDWKKKHRTTVNELGKKLEEHAKNLLDLDAKTFFDDQKNKRKNRALKKQYGFLFYFQDMPGVDGPEFNAFKVILKRKMCPAKTIISNKYKTITTALPHKKIKEKIKTFRTRKELADKRKTFTYTPGE